MLHSTDSSAVPLPGLTKRLSGGGRKAFPAPCVSSLHGNVGAEFGSSLLWRDGRTGASLRGCLVGQRGASIGRFVLTRSVGTCGLQDQAPLEGAQRPENSGWRCHGVSIFNLKHQQRLGRGFLSQDMFEARKMAIIGCHNHLGTITCIANGHVQSRLCNICPYAKRLR